MPSKYVNTQTNPTVSVRVSVAVMKYHDQKQLDKEGLFHLCILITVHRGKSRQEFKQGSWTQELREGLRGVLSTGLYSWFAQLLVLTKSQLFDFPNKDQEPDAEVKACWLSKRQRKPPVGRRPPPTSQKPLPSMPSQKTQTQ